MIKWLVIGATAIGLGFIIYKLTRGTSGQMMVAGAAPPPNPSGAGPAATAMPSDNYNPATFAPAPPPADPFELAAFPQARKGGTGRF